MEQLRTALNWLKRYHFWVLSIVVVGVAIGCWYSAAGALSKEFQTHQATIKSEFDSQARLARESFHANDTINEQQQEQIKKQADSVLQTWESLYKRQQEETLNWPEEFDETFLRVVERLKFGDDIRRDLREQYFNYIKNYFPKLPAIVNARVLAANERGGRGARGAFGPESFGPEMGGMRGGAQDVPDDNYLVDWQDQAHVRQELEWQKTPTPLQIWVTQENLWVYRTLLQIVADTNEGATRRTNAPVRVIESLEVGRSAAEASKSSGRIFVPESSSTGVRGMGMMPELGGSMPSMERSMGGGEIPSSYGMGMGMSDSGQSGDDRAALLSGRYLDKNGRPIPVAGTSTGPEEFGVEYKRLPVRMVLEMDETAIPKLIANCANQPLQVEVQQVRINPDGVRGNRLRSSFGNSSSNLETFDAQPNIATVVIHGIIYILNEPNTATLQIAGT